MLFISYTKSGHWNLLYELSKHELEAFDAEFDDLIQHRLRASRDFYSSSGWNASIYAQTLLGDGEDALSLGVYLQKSF